MIDEKYLVQSTAEKRQPQILMEFGEMEAVLVSLAEASATLEKHLDASGLLRSEPAEAGKPSGTESTIVGVAERIRSASRQIDSVTRNLRSVDRRLEI